MMTSMGGTPFCCCRWRLRRPEETVVPAHCCIIISLLILVRVPAVTEATTLWSDVAALQGLLNAWNTTEALAGNWSLQSDPCWSQWHGVSCLQDSVVALRLSNSGIVGSLPPVIGSFVNLQYLELAGNPKLGGAIPEEIGNLTSLFELDLSNCSFSGWIPSCLGNLVNVKLIYLAHNQLSGEIPYTVGLLDKLLQLSLANNQLSGNIPVSVPGGNYTVGLNNLTSLLILDLSSNQLIGDIPAALGQLSKLSTLLLSQNVLTGCIPCSISQPGGKLGLDNLTAITHLDASNNFLSGSVPEFLFSLPILSMLNLSSNQFAGILDGNVTRSVNLQMLLERNNITGVVNFPSEFLNAKLAGNPVCENQSFPLVELCDFSSPDIAGPLSWNQPNVCTAEIVCQQNKTVDPATCNCSYPLLCDMYIHWSLVFSMTAPRFGQLRMEFATQFSLNLDQVWVTHSTFRNAGRTQVLVTVLFFPPAHTSSWPASQITSIQIRLQNRNISLTGSYEPYGLVSSVQFSPSGGGPDAANGKKLYRERITAAVVVGAVAAALLVFMIFMCLTVYCCRKWRTPRLPSLDHASEMFDLNCHQQQQPPPCVLISYEELKAATKNFHHGNKIGEGIFGTVYKGMLRDGTEVAITQLPSKSSQDDEHFLDEVQLIARMQHKNLVRLQGCALSGKHRLLVYEYLENRNLDQVLFGPIRSIVLEWPIRYNIAVGIANGLAYLHGKLHSYLVHGDIKASTVVVDKYLEPKIADFGWAKICQTDEKKVHTRIEGKRGYIAPEYALHGQLTAKADVFSFGIVALELVSGRQNMNPKLPQNQQYLLSWAWQLWEENRILELVDPKVKDNCDEDQVLLLIQVALLCSQDTPASRPNMMRVVSILSGGDMEAAEIPVRPAFLGLGTAEANPRPSTRPSSLTTWK
ncbi:hypothetical protein BDL97_17G007800 [Sphagnum fallax]|nr:hypothetical protein BDL97_17G007800 [Sphagnum fallax]